MLKHEDVTMNRSVYIHQHEVNETNCIHCRSNLNVLSMLSQVLHLKLFLAILKKETNLSKKYFFYVLNINLNFLVITN